MTNGPFATPSSQLTGSQPPADPGSFRFPKQNRLLRRSEFLEVYNQGFRVTGSCFAAFCWRSAVADGPKFGFTATRSLGKSVVRNRIKRRVREQVRLGLKHLPAEWHIVFNLRPGALDAPVAKVKVELERLSARCAS